MDTSEAKPQSLSPVEDLLDVVLKLRALGDAARTLIAEPGGLKRIYVVAMALGAGPVTFTRDDSEQDLRRLGEACTECLADLIRKAGPGPFSTTRREYTMNLIACKDHPNREEAERALDEIARESAFKILVIARAYAVKLGHNATDEAIVNRILELIRGGPDTFEPPEEGHTDQLCRYLQEVETDRQAWREDN